MIPESSTRHKSNVIYLDEEVKKFNAILKSFSIAARCVKHRRVENYFYYDVLLDTKGKVKDLHRYADEISLALKTPGRPNIRVLHTLGIVRLEFAELREKPLKLFDYFTNKGVPEAGILCLLGQNMEGGRMWMDLSQNPHMIIAGTTGSGKSILLHNIIANLLNYNAVNLILIDPKGSEFHQYTSRFDNISVHHSFDESLSIIREMVEVMETRYHLMRHGTPATDFPNIVIIIDEFADISMQDDQGYLYQALCRLAQKCRAARMHIILATQRPSRNIIDGVIKANFPVRIACRVASQVDSKVVLDAIGAENLLGKGDALVRDNLGNLERFQVAHTDADEVCKIFGSTEGMQQE